MRTDEAKPEPRPEGAPVDPRQEQAGARRPGSGLFKLAVVVVLLAAALGAGYSLMAGPASQTQAIALATDVVMRGDLTVTVTEGGSLIALEYLDIKNRVEGGQRTIVEVVEEGTVITQQDVDDGMVLVKLDSSDLEERESSREIDFYNTEAAYKQAEESLAIQQKQNESNIAIAGLNVKFARMELERYLGADLADKVLKEATDFGALGDNDELGGLAQQELRSREADVQLATEELSRADETLAYTQKLHEKGYVNRNELTADELAVTRRRIELEAAQEDLRLFGRYTLPKEAEQRYSEHVEYTQDLDRVQARARSQVAQAEADLKSRKASYELEKERLEKLREMITRCTIKAPKPGRVVYPATLNPWGHRRDPIREGARTYQNQTLLVIPELATLAARVNLHETDIRKVEGDERAVITIEAIPGRAFRGHVTSISPVASSAHAWLNPEIKVYGTEVALDEVPDGLTPGMTATAEIIVAELTDVLYVAVEAVTTLRGQQVCLVAGLSGPVVRRVETGHFTGKFVEIKSGLQEGEVVYLEPGEELATDAWDATPQLEQELEKLTEEADEEVPSEGAGEGLPEPAEAAEEEPSEGAEIDWRAFAQLRDLAPEEREKKLQELLEKMTPEQRKQFEERSQGRQQGGGAGGPRGREGGGAGDAGAASE